MAVQASRNGVCCEGLDDRGPRLAVVGFEDGRFIQHDAGEFVTVEMRQHLVIRDDDPRVGSRQMRAYTTPSMPNFAASRTVCAETASGARISTRPGMCCAHSSCIGVLPMPQSAKMAARPRRSAQVTMSCWNSNSAGLSAGTSDNPVDGSMMRLRSRNS